KGAATRMLNKLLSRLEATEGFTMFVLFVVILILCILMAIAIPSYLGFKDRANKSAAQANVRSAVPGVEAYAADHNGYVGVDLARSEERRVGKDWNTRWGATAPKENTYCIHSNVGRS